MDQPLALTKSSHDMGVTGREWSVVSATAERQQVCWHEKMVTGPSHSKHCWGWPLLWSLVCLIIELKIIFVPSYSHTLPSVWESTHEAYNKAIFILQKPTKPLFIKLNAVKFHHLVDLKTIRIIHKANQRQFPQGIQKLFQIMENKNDLLWGGVYVQKQRVHTNTKTHCTSVKWVNLWNSCRENMRTRTSLNRFKQMYANYIFYGYKTNTDRNLWRINSLVFGGYTFFFLFLSSCFDWLTLKKEKMGRPR